MILTCTQHSSSLLLVSPGARREDFHTFTCCSCRIKRLLDTSPKLFLYERVHSLSHVSKQCAVTHIPLPVPYTEWEAETEEGEAGTLKETVFLRTGSVIYWADRFWSTGGTELCRSWMVLIAGACGSPVGQEFWPLTSVFQRLRDWLIKVS